MVKFYEQNVPERIQLLHDTNVLSDEHASLLHRQYERSSESAVPLGLPADIADHMVENQIGQFTLPVGIVRGLVVNGVARNILLATEEPSVIAAANNGARITAFSDGITATSKRYLTQAQIVFEDENGSLRSQLAAILHNKHNAIMQIAQHAHPSIVQRGGGLRDVQIIDLPGFTQVLISVDTLDAMGANIVNTIAEALKAQLAQWLNRDALVAILTNTSSVATIAHTTIAVEALIKRNLPYEKRATQGYQLAKRIASLSKLANVDSRRAATHNKGIFNGICAAALATGNDTRALQVAADAWAARDGQLAPLATWKVEQQDNADVLCGTIEIPLQVGIVGGAINSLPMAQLALNVGNFSDNNDYRNVLASLGLVQNLAALRALASEGIQAGHMRLQAGNLAISAGAHGEAIAQVAERLQTLSVAERTVERAQELLAEICTEQNIRNEKE